MSAEESSPCEGIAELRKSVHGLQALGIQDYRKAYWNLPASGYYEETIYRGEGAISRQGALVVRSGKHTARAAADKFIVREPGSEEDIFWGEYNLSYNQEDFNRIFEKMKRYLVGKDLFVQDGTAGASQPHQLPVRVISSWAWHGLFARNIFISPKGAEEYRSHKPEFTVIILPEFKGDPLRDHLNSSTFILLDFSQRLVLIGDTGYGGEIKKSIFTALNYYLPRKKILTMHCAANVGKRGDAALFFGLSGTGKTTLSADPNRQLIGDDEHGWDEEGVFNFEDGSYAKVIDLSPTAEPEIFSCSHQYGTLLENVIMDPESREVDLFDDRITRNTRATYPLHCIPYSLPSKRGGHPKNIVLLTFDANGVMPPIARLSPEQSLYHFISGYTSKVGGTEAGVGESPEITFSACFGAPFLVFHPGYYAALLKENICRHQVKPWLINTGLVGGPAGVGERISLTHTRALLTAALDGSLDDVAYRMDPFFRFQVPKTAPGVPAEILTPSTQWADPTAYQKQYRQLAVRFQENFRRYQADVAPEIANAGPHLN